MSQYMLDTNMVGFLIRGQSAVLKRVTDAPPGALCISAVTRGEIMFGLNRRPARQFLLAAVTEFLRRVDVLPWNSEVADTYGVVRAELERIGKALGALDMMIGAHALCLGAVLVTNDQAFRAVANLNLEDWTQS
jgi:tRNA(fMet)-specific endonuclease VapC